MPTCTTSKSVPMRPIREGSRHRPTRDRDDVGQMWKELNKTQAQLRDTLTAFDQLTRTVEAQRRRILGGSGTTGTSNNLKGEYSGTIDTNGGYSLGNIVVISTGDNQGTYGYINGAPSSGAASPWVGGGYWIQLPGGLQSQWM
jgi:hypothetical protein